VAVTLFICNAFLKERRRHEQANVRFRFRLVNTGPRTTSARRRPSAPTPTTTLQRAQLLGGVTYSYENTTTQFV
jgi:hypothetical protein